jgi:multidrug efflux pump subunit AcrB
MSNDLQPRQRGPIAWMAGNSVASNLVMLMCLVGGFLALLNVKQEVFPDIQPDIVTVTVPYPGASPEEVEEGVLTSIEEAVRSLDGVDEVTSVAREGSGTVNVEALLGADLQKLSQDVQNEVDRITTFPDEAEEPEVRIATRRRPVLSLLLAGEVQPTVLRALGEQARDILLQDPSITQVDLTGVPDLEIAVEISEQQLRRYGLTLREVAARIRSASIDLPAGGLDTASGEILVRVKERRDYGREFARIPIITTAQGAVVRLGEIATIDDGFEDTDRYTLLNGKPAVELEVYRVGDQTPLDVSAAVHEHMDEIHQTLPPGVIVEIQRDRSTYYRQRVELLLKNGAIGLALVLVVLGLFLEARLAFWVMMGIPISFLGSFLILPSTGVTVNMISLFAYIVALGIVVDDAIVVGENIYHYHQEGMPFHQAAVRGAREVAMPVTFSILTNVVAFMPMLFIPGVTGKIFMMIPAVVITVFVISLVESLFVLPAHLAHQKDRRRYGLAAKFHNAQQRFSRAFTNWVKNRYGPFLEFCLHHRLVTVSIAVALLLASIAYAASGRMGFQLFPVVESDRSEATVVLPYGAPVEKTQAVLDRIEAGAKEVLAESGRPELVQSITTDVGRGGSHTGRVRVELAEADLRSEIMSTSEFTRRWRQAVGEIEGVEFMKFAADSGGPGSRGRPVEVQLSHRDIDVLRDASQELASEVETYPRVKDVDDGFQPGKRQLDFQLTPAGKALGLTAAEVARQARAALYGAEALRQQRGRSEIKVMVRLPQEDRSTEQTARDLMIATPAGTYVPLREVATMERGRAYTTIDRRNGRRVVTVSADVTPRARAGEVLGDLQSTELKDLTTKYPGLTYSFEGAQADIAESMGSLKVMFAVALLAIYAMLAIPFRSYAQPLIVMVSIPFGIVGAFVGHLIMGYSLAIPSMFGIVALAGVVVNDSLVLVDFANRRRREDGMNYHDSITAAGIQRFRPVVLTTLTTFGGLAPMIFETSRQARFLIPMALSLGFGILFATAITLILVPTLYMSIEDITREAAALKRWLFPPHEPTGDAPARTGAAQTEESERSS